MLSVITAVRDRPKAFPLCLRWLSAQTYTDFEWIIVDDGNNRPDDFQDCFDLRVKYIRRPPSDCPMTYPENLLEGLKHIGGDHFTIVEDDDWMSPLYLEKMIEGLRDHEVVGRWGFPLYHLPTGRYQPKIRRFPTKTVEGGVGVHANILTPHFLIQSEVGVPWLKRGLEKAVSGRNRLTKTRTAQRGPLVFWQTVLERCRLLLINDDEFLSIKGMPGRSITSVHRDEEKIRSTLPGQDNETRDFLRGITGEDAANRLLRTVGLGRGIGGEAP